MVGSGILVGAKSTYRPIIGTKVVKMVPAKEPVAKMFAAANITAALIRKSSVYRFLTVRMFASRLYPISNLLTFDFS